MSSGQLKSLSEVQSTTNDHNSHLVVDVVTPQADVRVSTAPSTHSGAGPIGLVTLLAAHAAGCYPIIITDLFQSRLDFAKTLVSTVRTVVIDRSDDEPTIAGKIEKAAEGKVRVALECSGVESSIRAAIFVGPSLRLVSLVSAVAEEEAAIPVQFRRK